tara:strand:- start:95 stop:553 length:459 start_codon:yes stop_codon:yes gene_type:complete
MVALLRPELEHFDIDHPEATQDRHLQVVGAATEVLSSPTRALTRRETQRTYWRRRITCIAVLAGLLWMIAGPAGLLDSDRVADRPTEAQTLIESAAGESLTAGQVVIVKPGDTLWSIARKIQPTGDVRPLVDRIATLNSGHALIAGQALLLP